MPSHSHITSACLLHFESRGRGSGVTLSLLSVPLGPCCLLGFQTLLSSPVRLHNNADGFIRPLTHTHTEPRFFVVFVFTEYRNFIVYE